MILALSRFELPMAPTPAPGLASSAPSAASSGGVRPGQAPSLAGLDRAPFRWTGSGQDQLPVRIRGTVPAWLRGDLVRTAPALFEQNGWRADHWFDGLGLLYGFRFDAAGVSFRQRLLDSQVAADAAQGQSRLASFGTRTRRSRIGRLLQPVPQATDNTNVNVIPWQGAWLALTESQHQHVIDPDDLASRGLYQYEDGLPAGLMMTAHPHFDHASKALVNVGTSLGRRNQLLVFRQKPGESKRQIEGSLSLERSPYLHDFGVSERHVVLIDHPLRLSGLSMLFSNRSLMEHHRWEPEQGTRLRLLDRQSGRWTTYETDTFFCFHTVNCFDDGEDVVFDFLAYDDASEVGALGTEALASGQLPALTPRYLRARLRPGGGRVELEPLSPQGFEFPAIAYRQQHGQPYSVAWGASFPDTNWQSQLLRVEAGQVRRFEEEGMVYGEPIFVPSPQGEGPTDGVLLSVGCHLGEPRSSLVILDAEQMRPIAHCDLELSLPLGFHGNFQAR